MQVIHLLYTGLKPLTNPTACYARCTDPNLNTMQAKWNLLSEKRVSKETLSHTYIIKGKCKNKHAVKSKRKLAFEIDLYYWGVLNKPRN